MVYNEQFINLFKYTFHYTPINVKVKNIHRVSKSGYLLKWFEHDENYCSYIILPKFYTDLLNEDLIKTINNSNKFIFIYDSINKFTTLTDDDVEIKPTSEVIIRVNIKVNGEMISETYRSEYFYRKSLFRKPIRRKNIPNKDSKNDLNYILPNPWYVPEENIYYDTWQV